MAYQHVSAGPSVATACGVQSTIRRLVCATDFSPQSHDALRVAARLAHGGGELVIAHAQKSPAAVEVELPEAARIVSVDPAAEDRELAAARIDAARLGAERTIATRASGSPAEAIVELADESHADLVVTGSHGRTGAARLLLGSVAEAIVRRATCPVLVTRLRGDDTSFSHVLCAVDVGDASRRAARLAAELATADGARLTLLHVLEIVRTYVGNTFALPANIEQEHVASFERFVDELRAATPAQIDHRVRRGVPADCVLDMLDSDPTFDLVAMGTHRRTRLDRAVLGSAAKRVVRHAPCSVLVAQANPA